MALTYDTRGGEVVASLSDPAADTAANPAGPEHTQVIGFDAGSGKIDWHREGALAGDQFTPYKGGLLTVGYDDTAYTFDPAEGGPGDSHSQTMPLAGDPLAAVTADVNGDGVKDMIVGGQSRGVFAVDGRTLKKPDADRAVARHRRGLGARPRAGAGPARPPRPAGLRRGGDRRRLHRPRRPHRRGPQHRTHPRLHRTR